MSLKLKNINYEELEKRRKDVADKLMSIVDEDGQPMFNEEWIKENILSKETENPE